jgi:2-oxo-4-hydroxy-4-carboxy--5-ureidoimidazoline (OHCU) decarboxylase
MSTKKLTIVEVNELDYGEFIRILGNVVEHCAVFAGAIWAQRPFGNVQELHSRFEAFMDSLPDIGKKR